MAFRDRWTRHNEWLLDEAIKETFPASDPVSAGQPGSIVGLRYTAEERAREQPRGKGIARSLAWLAAGSTLCLAVYYLTARRRGR
jgi:hypothetical protein